MGEEVVEKQILEEKMIGKDDEDEKMIGKDDEAHHFVLVHGIGGGAWCWYKLRCLLENSGGCKVTCLDLKASGIDPADANSLLSFDDYNKPLIDFLASLPHNQQVILVGHSAGGLSVTDASHKFPQKISLAVYVSATMLKTGFNSEQDIKDGDLSDFSEAFEVYDAVFGLGLNETPTNGVPDLSDFGEAFEVYDAVFGLGLNETPTSLLVKKEFQREIIYQMSPFEDSTLAAMLLRPGPIKALLNACFQEGEDDVEKVPRIYIRAMHDNVVKPAQQDAMIKRWPPAAVYTLECDHSPFFSAPFMLSGVLLRAATSLGMLKY